VARRARLIIAGLPHHLIVRGNDRQAIFRDDADRRRFKADLAEIAAEVEVAIHGYVMMTNHVHLIATPEMAEALSGAIQRLGRRYVRYYNDRYQRTGTLWEGRFRAALIEADRYLLACLRYVEDNPVRAGLVRRPADYPWSSHRHHVGLTVDELVSPHPIYWGLGNTPFEREQAWLALFEERIPDSELARMRAMAMGTPAAEKGYLAVLGQQTGRALLARPVGRPRKSGVVTRAPGLGEAFAVALPDLKGDDG
jgi:putative transposase